MHSSISDLQCFTVINCSFIAALMNAVAEQQNPPQCAVDTPTKTIIEWGTPVAAARLRRWLEDGPRSLRVASFGANFFVVLSAVTHIFSDLFTLHPLSALVNCYLVAFGIAGMTVEIEMCHATGRCKMRLVHSAGFLRHMTGRGILYLFIGNLCWAQGGAFLVLTGLGVTLVAIANLCVASRARTELAVIRAQLSSEAVVRAKFAEMDVNGSGTLSPAELATLTQALGSALSTHQLTRFMEDLDADCDGAVSLEDYVAWITQGTVPRDANSSIVASTPTPAGSESLGNTAAGHTLDAGTAEMQQLELWQSEGHQVLRFLSGTSAVLLMLCGAVLIIASLASWALFSALINLYIFAFGAVTLAVELMAARKFSFLHRIRQEVVDEAQFLLHTWGRGLLHIFAGSLALGQWSPMSNGVGWLAMFVGVFAIAIGASHCGVGGYAMKRISILQREQAQKHNLRASFDRFDAKHNGTLDASQLHSLCRSLGHELGHEELEKAILLMDTNRDGTIQYQEFVLWWQTLRHSQASKSQLGAASAPGTTVVSL